MEDKTNGRLLDDVCSQRHHNSAVITEEHCVFATLKKKLYIYISVSLQQTASELMWAVLGVEVLVGRGDKA